jgi:hypothetical protein
MSELFRTKGHLTLAQLARAWSSELTQPGEDPQRCEQHLIHILQEDILNGRLDDSGPPRDGDRLGLRWITPDNKAQFIEGRELLEAFRASPQVLHYVIAMKEAVLNFAERRQLRCPSWWAEWALGPPTEVSKATMLNAVSPEIGAAASRSVGKQPRILRYLSEHFPGGVPEPGLCPREELKAEILKWDRRLGPLDDATLKRGIDNYNTSLRVIRFGPNRIVSDRTIRPQ